MRRGTAQLLRRSAAALTLALWAGVSVSQTLTPDQMRVLAAQAVGAGQSETARELSTALVARDASDVSALLTLSRAERDLGNYQAAQEAASRAWRAAADDRQRYAAALAAAQALSSDGKRTRAQLWLRRAIEVAPSEGHKARAVRDFRYVRARNPWSTSLSFSIAPSSNVNGGSSNEEVDLFLQETALGDLYLENAVLGPTAQALSGLEVSGGVTTSYSLTETARTRTRVNLALYHRTYILSESAKDRAPDAEGSDFAYTTASLGLSRDWMSDDKRVGLSYGASLGRGWYAGDPLTRSARLTGALKFAVTPKLLTRASLGREWEWGEDGRADATSWRAALGATRILGSGHRLSASLSHTANSSDAAYLDYDLTELSLDLALSKPILGTEVSLGTSAARRHHDEIAFAQDGREDDRYSISATFAFTEADYYGFVPDMTLRATRTESNLGLYDSEEYGISFGIRSKF